MAVNNTRKPVLMREYLEQYQNRSSATIAGFMISASLIITVILSLCHLMPPLSIPFWATFIIIAIIATGTSMWLFWSLTRPFRDLVSEIVVIAGEPTVLRPPNPNQRHYNEDGFKQILQTVYELAATKSQPAIIPEAADETLQQGLNQTSSGLVILDQDKHIVYSNNKAPVSINRQGEKKLDVVFPNSESLLDWLAECDTKSVHAENTWTRISDKVPGEHGRHVYDISASYHRGSKAETVITFFDRTTTYAPEEDDLDFISFAAHELRGPITVIRGYLDVLENELEPVLENDQAELLQRLIVSSNRLSSYVNNILNASRYDRRNFKMHLAEDSIASIYDVISDDMQLRASSQNRMLTIDIPKGLPTVAADKNSIGEVMSNLIDNAIKYSNEGGQVTVKARAISGYVEVAIIDRGIGMPTNVIPNLFHKFYRSHRSRETVAGTGIGLYISKAIIESHGGTVEVRSTEREGSTFTFTLPIYDTVASKLKAGNETNQLLRGHGGGWIRNHSMYRS